MDSYHQMPSYESRPKDLKRPPLAIIIQSMPLLLFLVQLTRFILLIGLTLDMSLIVFLIITLIYQKCILIVNLSPIDERRVHMFAVVLCFAKLNSNICIGGRL